eukprot:TRINITY_DN39792_c0_g1_i1.p1 TRINITY_DN39792_c0_g1~~TRINITY_DN39792_c0_g1_i1.p1  ORF type:complete len:293 (+),score=46.90 TRINITY_DN39792_c0_g1_i1:241-1119(+)
MYYPYAFLPCYVQLLALLIFRIQQPALLALSAFPVVYHAAALAPVYTQRLWQACDDGKSSGRASLRVFSSNLLMVNRQTAGILGEWRASDADVVLLQEYSPVWDKAVQRHPDLLRLYPHCIKRVQEDSFGTAIYSKLPLVDAEVFYIARTPFSRAFVQVDGVTVRLYNIHSLPPRLDYTPTFNTQMQALCDMVRKERLDYREVPVVVCGDMNCSPWNRWMIEFRTMVEERRKGKELCARGHASRGKKGGVPVPPVRLDHAFISTENATCRGISEGEGQGSDHLPLIVDIELP